MTQILALALTDIRMAFSERSTWFVTFAMPLVFTALLALGSGARPTEARVTLLVVDEDRGPVAAQLLEALNRSSVVELARAAEGERLPTTRAEAVARLDAFTRILLLPAGSECCL